MSGLVLPGLESPLVLTVTKAARLVGTEDFCLSKPRTFLLLFQTKSTVRSRPFACGLLSLNARCPNTILYPCGVNYFIIYSDRYNPKSQKKVSRPGGFPGNDRDTVHSLRRLSNVSAHHMPTLLTPDMNRQPFQAPRSFPLTVSCIIRRV